MRVIDYINQANPEEIQRIYSSSYTEDGWSKPESFIKFRDVMNDTIGVKMADEQFKVIIQYVIDDFMNKVEEYFDVGGRQVSSPENVWSLSFTPWGEWKEMEVDDESGKELSIDEIAAHLYYEITWYGWPDSQQKQKDDLDDQLERINRDFANYKEGDPLPDGYHEWKPNESD